ncbi:MAG: hypothetical protein IT435_18110 [Phycisphaerales bacterium]|nr:hypothetical protein [Phycisphaerales bacterium]
MNVRVIGMIAGAALVAATGASSSAAVVVYENFENEFFWEIGVHNTDHTEMPGTFLDITQPASQSGERKPGTFGKWYNPNIASGDPAIRYLRGEPSAEVVQTTELKVLEWNGGFVAGYMLREFEGGEQVQVNARWRFTAPYFYHFPFSDDLAFGTPAISESAFVGVRTTIAGRWHYGWILFTDLKWPYMWAYETEPDMPIQIPVPAPSAGICLTIASLGLCSRQRQR